MTTHTGPSQASTMKPSQGALPETRPSVYRTVGDHAAVRAAERRSETISVSPEGSASGIGITH